ncbi:hypothetical protein HZB01_01165 [Candidatus Woesearchaeota archaeon]|nr:hypothetical protein [Candidatus Woesearchaeota archaeon]
MNKKGFNFFENMVELVMLIALIIGFLLALFLASAVLSYITIIACGFISGRLFFRRKDSTKIAYYIIIGIFLIGYILGDFYGDKRAVMLLFLIANIISFKLHQEGYVRD